LPVIAKDAKDVPVEEVRPSPPQLTVTVGELMTSSSPPTRHKSYCSTCFCRVRRSIPPRRSCSLRWIEVRI